MKNKVSIIKIGKVVGKCYNFENVWTGYNPDIGKIDIICAINKQDYTKDIFNQLQSKISVNIAKEYGTKFVEDFCNITIIRFL